VAPVSQQYVKLADKSQIPILGEGDTFLVNSALYIPELGCGIISVPALDRTGYEVTFRCGECIVELDGIIVMEAHLNPSTNLYDLDQAYINILCDNRCYNYRSGVNDISPQEWGRDFYNEEDEEAMEWYREHRDDESVIGDQTEDDDEADERLYQVRKKTRFSPQVKDALTDLHQRWGHLSENRIKLALRKKLVLSDVRYDDIKTLSLPLCVDCMRGRMKADPHKRATDHAWKLFEKVACDYKGPFDIRSFDGFTGIFLFSDYYSHFVYVYPVKKKSEMLDAVKSFFNRCVRSTGSVMKSFQTDYENLNISSAMRGWLYRHQIKLSLSAPYRHDQNGQIERDIQNVMDRTRTVLASYDVPHSFWEYALRYACWCINRSPTSRHDNKTPFELVYKTIPDLREMIPFYCPCNKGREERKSARR
jgi:hypothetical protein